MRQWIRSGQFKKDVKRAGKQGKDMEKLKTLVHRPVSSHNNCCVPNAVHALLVPTVLRGNSYRRLMLATVCIPTQKRENEVICYANLAFTVLSCFRMLMLPWSRSNRLVCH